MAARRRLAGSKLIPEYLPGAVGQDGKIFCNAAPFLRKKELETLRCRVPTAPPGQDRKNA